MTAMRSVGRMRRTMCSAHFSASWSGTPDIDPERSITRARWIGSRWTCAAAPAAAQVQREPIHLALVIDRSGSMSGVPLQEALKCAEHIVRRMRPTDRIAVIAYDDE